jgi:hypothetical protein
LPTTGNRTTGSAEVGEYEQRTAISTAITFAYISGQITDHQ